MVRVFVLYGEEPDAQRVCGARRAVPARAGRDVPPREGVRRPDGRAGAPLLSPSGSSPTRRRSRPPPRATSSCATGRTRATAASRSRRSSSPRSPSRSAAGASRARRRRPRGRRARSCRGTRARGTRRTSARRGAASCSAPASCGGSPAATPAASRMAIARARSSSSSSGTQSETSPIRSASTPSTGSQSSRWYFALASPHRSGQTIAAWSPAATPSFVWPSTMRAVGRRDRDVGEQPDREPGADRGAGHRRDDRLRAVDHVVDEVARLVEDAPPRLVVGRDLEHEVEVAARAERAVGAADEHRAGLVVVADRAPDRGELAVHRPADGVQPPGRGQRQPQHVRRRPVELEARKRGVALQSRSRDARTV